MKSNFILLTLSIFIMAGCNQSTKEKSEVSDSETPDVIQKEALKDNNQNTIEEVDHEDEEIREFGRIVGIEDSGYPMHIITIEFPERNMKRDFNFNVEAGIMSLQEIMALKNKYVTLHYTSDLKPMLYDIHSKGVTLLGEYAPESTDGLKEITGILSGANDATRGDLPGKINVASESGEIISFEEFVTEKMVNVNGHKVTVFYEMRGTETITNIEASEE